MYPENSIYVVGNSRTTNDNPITFQYSSFFIAFVVDPENGKILDLGTSVTLPVTERFIQELFRDRSIEKVDEEFIREIYRRYYGSSDKAIVVAYKDAVKKFQEIKKTNK